MGDAVRVFLRSSRIPTVEQWNAAIKSEGFDLILDPFDPLDDDGYRPAMLSGAESGFEWYLSKLDPDDLKPSIANSDHRAQLCFTSYADENVAAFVAGAVLAKLSGGYLVDNESGRLLQGDEAIALARREIQEWQQRGLFKRDAETVAVVPPIITPLAVPPKIPSQTHAAVPIDQPPLIPVACPPIVMRYRLWCALFVVMYLGMVVFEVLNVRGEVDAPLGIVDELFTKKGSPEREQAIAEAREKAVGGAVVASIAAAFYCFAALIPRRPWAWTVGAIAILGSFFPFIITIVGTIPLFMAWVKPETKRYFLSR